MTNLQNTQDLYNRNLFLRAYKQSTAYWSSSTIVKSLSTDELVLGGRLAARLGGLRLARRLFREARAQAPYNPRVRYFTRHISRPGCHLIDDLRAFEDNPDLGGDDAELRASWFASYAVVWANLRDFARAEECLERARSLGEHDSWVLSCESDVRDLADRWQDALESAERAFEISPGAPYVIRSICKRLARLNRLQEAAERAVTAAATCESYEIAGTACFHLCALAETLNGVERRAALDRARSITGRLESLAPLADRETKLLFAHIRLDIAHLLADRDEMEKWTEEIRSPYHRRIMSNLRKTPTGLRISLPFQPVRQRHLTCLPASLASALAAVGVEIDANKMSAEITYNGTPDWAAAEWLEKRGLVVRFFIPNSDCAANLIKNGIPFVLMLSTDDSSHAIAVVGMEEDTGTLMIHDPGNGRPERLLLTDLSLNKGPFEPIGMAAVAPAMASLLDHLLAGAHPEVATASRRYQKANDINGAVLGRRVVDELAQQHPMHPGTRCLEAIQTRVEGRTREALAALQQLLIQFPNSSFIRNQLLSTYSTLGNVAMMRKLLADVVEHGIFSGVQSGQDWRHPPATYVCQYAELLHHSAASRKQARALLRTVLLRQPLCAEAWHILGDLLWAEHDMKGALISYRMASCLDDHNEHYAQAHQIALTAAGREQEGLAWLEARARRLGASPRGSKPWISWIGALERFGYAEHALAACHEAIEKHCSPELLAFGSPLFARMGHWEESEAFLRELEAGGRSSLYCQAAMQFYRMRGDLNAAIRFCEEWSRNFPLDMTVRRQWLDLISRRDGAHAAVDLARTWWRERPGHDQLEELYCDQMDRVNAGWKKDLVLARRVKRNSEDGWAWRELAYRRLSDYASATAQRREKLHPIIEKLLRECDRTGPETPATWRAHALWSERQGRRSEAVTGYLKAIEAEPDNFFSYHRIWDSSATFAEADRRKLFEEIEPILLNSRGRLYVARQVAFLLAQRFGVAAAEQTVNRWMATRPNDPEVIGAVADLLLQYGRGRSDTERATALLESAVDRFPYCPDLQFSLAQARKNLGRDTEAKAALREIIRRHPDHTPAQLELASIQERLGDLDGIGQILDKAADHDPLNPVIWRGRVAILIRSGSLSNARVMIHQGLERMPDNVERRESAVNLLVECGDLAAALQTAREGVRLYPNNAHLWLLLAETLSHSDDIVLHSEIEGCLRHSLALNVALFEAADSLSRLLTTQHRYDDAEEAMNDILPFISDPSPARGRLAWIQRHRGRREQAIEEMKTAVSAAPWYLWGWRALIRWLSEDQKWDMARSLLSAAPPEVSTDPQFREERLFILSHAGVPPAELDAEWNRLLSEFPQQVPLHLARYDFLRLNRRAREAASVLTAIQPLDPENPYVLARLVEVLAEENKQSEAIEILQRIWFAEREQSAWPAEYAWKAVERVHFDNEAYRDARWSLLRGSRPTPQALFLMAAHAMDREFLKKKAQQQRWRTLLPGPGARELLALLRMVDRADWASGHYRAVLFRQLSDFGYQRLVVRYWKRNPSAIEAHVDSWAQVGRALASLNRHREARKLLSDWRGRVGAPMWAVANYVICLSSKKTPDFEEVRSACAESLAGCTHDNCAKYLAHVEAEMCAVLGDVEAFRKTWLKHKGYFTGELEESEWFEGRRQHLLSDIPRLASLLERNQIHQFRVAGLQLREQHPSPHSMATGGGDQPMKADGIRTWLRWIVVWMAISGLANLLNQINAPR